MPATNFEASAAFLKSHPAARPVTPRRSKPQQNPESPLPNPERHSRKCRICKHPRRYDIEADFLSWRPTAEIAREFGLPDHSSVCRHARAVGLYDQRGEGICYALNPILEQADRVFMKLTPRSLISAVETYAKINDKGKRSRAVIHRHYISSADLDNLAAGAHRVKPAPRCAEALSSKAANRPIQELESTPTR